MSGFVSASNGKGPITARVEIDVLEGKQVRRKEVVVQDGDDLEELTKRAIYADCRIGEIRAAKDSQLLEVKLPGSETFLAARPGGGRRGCGCAEAADDPPHDPGASGEGKAARAAWASRC